MFILCYLLVYWCMSPFCCVRFSSFLYCGEWLTGKNVSEMTRVRVELNVKPQLDRPVGIKLLLLLPILPFCNWPFVCTFHLHTGMGSTDLRKLLSITVLDLFTCRMSSKAVCMKGCLYCFITVVATTVHSCCSFDFFLLSTWIAMLSSSFNWHITCELLLSVFKAQSWYTMADID